MEKDPLLPEASVNSQKTILSHDVIQARRGFMFTLFIATISGVGIHSRRQLDLPTRSVQNTLKSFSDGTSLGDVPLHVRTINVKNSTHALIVVEMPPLAPRKQGYSAEDPMKRHITPDVAAIMVELYKKQHIDTFAIDDRSYIEEQFLMQRALDSDTEYGHRMQWRDDAKAKITAGEIDKKEGDTIVRENQSKMDSKKNNYGQKRQNLQDLLGDNPELTYLLLASEIKIAPLVSGAAWSLKRFEPDALDPYAFPNYDAEETGTFLQNCAEGWTNVVILTGQPNRLEEAMQAFNTKNGPTFSASILTPARPSDAEVTGNNILAGKDPS